MDDLKDKKFKTWIKLMNFGHRLGCHQMPERSFYFKGYQFPVCARCTGVILGEVIGIILLFNRINISITLIIILLLVMGIDWFIQRIKLLESTNIRRLITGICGGISLTYIYFYIIKFCIVNIIKLFSTHL